MFLKLLKITSFFIVANSDEVDIIFASIIHPQKMVHFYSLVISEILEPLRKNIFTLKFMKRIYEISQRENQSCSNFDSQT